MDPVAVSKGSSLTRVDRPNICVLYPTLNYSEVRFQLPLLVVTNTVFRRDFRLFFLRSTTSKLYSMLA